MKLRIAGPEHLFIVERAGTIADIVATTYVPCQGAGTAANRSSAARAWLAEREAYLIEAERDGVVHIAGLIALRPKVDAGSGVSIPAGAAEWELFLFPEWRGQGLATSALLALRERARGRYRYLIGVAWVDNTASIRISERAGARYLGRSHWQGAGNAGPCEVHALSVPDEVAPAPVPSLQEDQLTDPDQRRK